jgi:hypothetical protein
MPEKLFIFTFLATSRLFLPPHSLLEKTLDFARKVVGGQVLPDEDSLQSTAGRYTRLLQCVGEDFSSFLLTWRHLRCAHVVNRLPPLFCPSFRREWTETFSYDFRDERMMVHFRELTKVLKFPGFLPHAPCPPAFAYIPDFPARAAVFGM